MGHANDKARIWHSNGRKHLAASNPSHILRGRASSLDPRGCSEGVGAGNYEGPLYFQRAVGSTPNSIYEVYPDKFVGNTTEIPTGYGSTIFSVTSVGDASLVYQAPALFAIGVIIPTINGGLFSEGGTPSSNNFLTLTRKGDAEKSYSLGGESTLGTYPFFAPSPSGDLFAVMAVTTEQYEIVKVALDGTITVLHTFGDGEGYPDRYAGIAMGPNGGFYGFSDTPTNQLLYKLSHTGAFAKVATLPAGNGNAGIVVAPDGTVYGESATEGQTRPAPSTWYRPPPASTPRLRRFPRRG